MSLQLGSYVAYGELRNTCRNSVWGWLGLTGMDHTILLELTGNCEPDLFGKHIRFRSRKMPEATFDSKSVPHFQSRHIGPVGKISAALQVCLDAAGNVLPPDSPENASTEWKPMLNIEWFGQNGRTVVQMVDPVVEFVGPENAGQEYDDAFFGALFSNDLADSTWEPDSPLSSTDGDDLFTTFQPSDWSPFDDDGEAWKDSLSEDDDLRNELSEMELMDDLLESEIGESLTSILDGSVPLPDPDTLDENGAAYLLRLILARLAIYGVAVHMCEHVTALDTYRIFREHIAPEAHCFRQLKGTGWVQNYSTSEDCPACEEEFEREWQEREGRDEN